MKSLVVAAVLLASAGLLPEAAARPQKARSALVPGAGDAEGSAEGRIDVRRDRRGERLRLTFRNLEPRTAYDVREGGTGERLAGFRTNARGRGKAKLSQDGLLGANLEICLPGYDDPVLEGEVPGGDEFGQRWDGDVSYASGYVSTEWDAEVQASISMSSWTDGSEEGSEESISLFVYGPGVEGPVSLWIADADGDLVEVASVEAWVAEDPGNFWEGEDGSAGNGEDGVYYKRGGRRQDRGGRTGRGGRDTGGRDGGDSGGRRGKGDAGDCPDASNGACGWDDGWVDPNSYFEWTASSRGDAGLPFEVDAVSDLSGRAFEVRDGNGEVILSGELPELEEYKYDDPWGNGMDVWVEFPGDEPPSQDQIDGFLGDLEELIEKWFGSGAE